MLQSGRHRPAGGVEESNRSLLGAKMAGTLDGFRVIDFGQYIAGPLVGMLLADQGADAVSYTHLPLPTRCSV